VVAAGGGDRAVGPETVLRAGASYVVAADHDVLDEVYDLFRGPRT
jgi:Trk K+ transport system NAD-binding subunit